MTGGRGQLAGGDRVLARSEPSRATVARLGWPTPSQRALLLVLVATAERARAAWHDFRRTATLAELDVGSRRLLPLVVQRLAALELSDPEIDRLRGVARHTWASNQERVRSCLEVVAAFSAAAVPVCALKGLALLHGPYGGDYAARPMYDTDLLVPAARMQSACERLLSLGFTSKPSLPVGRITSARLRTGMAHSFVRGYCNIDLHWHVLHQDPNGFFDAVAWQNARPLGAGIGGELLALAPTELLIHVLLHGVRHDSSANRIWALDAIVILERSGADIDWERFVRLARERCLSVALGDALGFVATLGNSVPDAVLAELLAEPVLEDELLEYLATTRGFRNAGSRARYATRRMAAFRQCLAIVTREQVRSFGRGVET